MTQDPQDRAACPDVEELSALIDREIDALRAGEIDAHLATCPACARLRWRLEQASGLARGLPRETASDELVERVARAAMRPTRRFGAAARTLAAAAAGLLGVVLLYRLVGIQQGMPLEPPVQVAQGSASPQAPAGAAAQLEKAVAPSQGVVAEAEVPADSAYFEDGRASLGLPAPDAERNDAATLRRARGNGTLAGGKRADVFAAASTPREEAKEETSAAPEPIPQPAANDLRRDADDASEGFSPAPAAPLAAARPPAAPMPSGPGALDRIERDAPASAEASSRELAAKSSSGRQGKLAKDDDGELRAQVGAMAEEDRLADDPRQAPADRCDVLLALISGGSVVTQAAAGESLPRLLTPGRLEVPSRWLSGPANVRMEVLVEADGSARACDVTISGVQPEARADVERRARDLVASWRYDPARRGDAPIAGAVSVNLAVVAAP